MRDKRRVVSMALVTPQGVEFGRLNYIPAVLAAYRPSGAQRRLRARLAALKDASITPEGKGADARSQALVDSAERAAVACLKKATGTDSAAAFATYRPFAAMAGGGFWLERVLSELDKVKANL